MKNILFIAPLAGGKGTQAKLLVENYGYVQVSTGELLRNVEEGSELRKKIEEIILSGALVPDEIVVELLKEKLLTIKENEPFVLDGFPRNVEQAEKLKDLLKEINRSLDLVIYLDVPYEESLNRTLYREVCSNCKASYNKYYNPSKVEGVCDKCSHKLIHRPEDNEETFKLRYDTYLKETIPLIEYYRKLNMLVRIDSKDINSTHDSIVSVIKND